MKKTVVIPTNRNVDNLEEWVKQLDGCHVIIVQDAQEFNLELSQDLKGLDISCYARKDIDEDLGNDSWIIPRKTDCIRSYGFLKAYQEGAEYIFTLDDDCFPVQEFWTLRHTDVLNLKIPNSYWTSMLCLRCSALSFSNVFPRGFPDSGTSQVMISHGGWLGVPDFDGETQLKFPNVVVSRSDFNTGIVPHGKFFPMSGMNIAFRREATPMMYFLLMGEGYPYHRFGDIWCGLFAKKICDHLGYSVSCSGPFIRHERKSNPAENVKKEREGKEINEVLWKDVNSIELDGTSIIDCYKEISSQFSGSTCSKGYWDKLSKAMLLWLEVLEHGS